MIKLILTLAIAVISWPVEADNYRMITLEKLPRTAQELLMRHFSETEISYVAAERSLFNRTYKVFLSDGCTIEFDRNGQWNDIDCGQNGMPEGVIPAAIREVIQTRFSGRAVEQIERTKQGYDVELREGPELRFDHRFKLIDVDD